jgi:hypothetical protein
MSPNCKGITYRYSREDRRPIRLSGPSIINIVINAAKRPSVEPNTETRTLRFLDSKTLRGRAGSREEVIELGGCGTQGPALRPRLGRSLAWLQARTTRGHALKHRHKHLRVHPPPEQLQSSNRS